MPQKSSSDATTMPIRVDLPAYSITLIVNVDPACYVFHLKKYIRLGCPGEPLQEGQRLFWHGKELDDETPLAIIRNDPKQILYLSVQPNAWRDTPPPIKRQPSRMDVNHVKVIRKNQEDRTSNDEIHDYNGRLAFVQILHQNSLAILSDDIPQSDPPPNLQELKKKDIDILESNGYEWPAIFDEIPHFVESGPGMYRLIENEGRPYLHLETDEGFNPVQLQALKILSYTFSILSMPLPNRTPTRTVQPRSNEVPHHVNQLLQQLNLPALRVANPHANAVNQNVLGEIRRIPIRPLLAPLTMLLFRTLLLLYFVAPARKPILGILILAWMLYEIWQPVRNALQNLRRIHENQRPANGAGPELANGQGQNAGQPNDHQAPGVPNAPPDAAAGPAPVLAPGALDLQPGAILDALANINIVDEERMLNAATETPVAEPSLGHRVTMFIGLFIATLHPAIWNRRRMALRRREGVVRTDANLRNAADADVDSSQATDNQREIQREALRARFNLLPIWLRRYTERVVAEDWVDDAE